MLRWVDVPVVDATNYANKLAKALAKWSSKHLGRQDFLAERVDIGLCR